MFHSATLKLTGWYLLILMSISLLFSAAIHQVTTIEVRERLSAFQSRFEQPDIMLPAPSQRMFSAYRNNQGETANHNIFMTLVYVNVLILVGGGTLSYLLARHTLRQIEDAHVAQSRFSSDASHELRTPLAAMKSELEVALRDPKLSKTEMHELLESNLEEVNKLTKLSQTLLHLSKMDYASLDITAIDIGSTLNEVVQRYDKNATRVKVASPKQPLIVKGNVTGIEELFTILVDNALKYSPRGSRITATLSKKGKHAVFTIANTGRGIPANKLPFIFDRFYRTDESRTESGAGLGLALAKEIVALHKGELSVSSAEKGDTTFQVLLPIIRKN